MKQETRTKLVVLDANFYWTEQLFSACYEFADVLLLRPVDFRTFKKRYGSYYIDFSPRRISEGVWEQRICCPPGWLFHYWFLTQRFLSHVVRRFQGSNPLVFAFNYPYYYSLAQELKGCSIYYSMDDYCTYWPGREAQTPIVESHAVMSSDITLCVAQHRAKHFKREFPQIENQIVHIPHGCSTKFMVEQVLDNPKQLPPEIQAFPRPIAGYIGALNNRFDFDYLAKVAERIPEVTVVLGGDIPQSHDGSSEWWQGVERVRQLPNVHFIGAVNHNQLGKYLQAFDVLLMSYSQCNFNVNACPTKLWDYMGTSRPIVSNNVVPEVNQWEDVLLIAKNHHEYADKIRFALNNPTWQAQERLKIAKTNTWKHQAEKLYQLLEEKNGCHFKMLKSPAYLSAR